MANKTSRLGRGFYDILEDNMPESKKGSGEILRIADVEPRHDQPRKTFEREALEALADSIGTYGVLQPIIVRKNGDTYEIIAGERRWRAAKMAGLSEIPAVVFDGDELKAAQVALIDRFGLTQDQVAKQVGKSRSAVTNMLRLLDLPDEVLEMLKAGEISAGHARALLGLDNEDQMASLAAQIVEKDLSVRDTEAAVKRYNALGSISEEPKVHPQIKAQMKELERRAMSSLGRKVRISRSSRKKVVELTYDDDADLEALLKALCGEKIFDETFD